MSRPSRTAWLLGGSLFSVATIAFGAVSLVDLLSHERSQVHVEFSETIHTLDVRSERGSVRIEGTDDSTVTVDAKVSDGLRSGDHSERVEGDRLVVRATCPAMFSQWCGVDYTIRVPRDTAVVAKASDAGVRVTNIDGDLQLSSSDGGVSATGLRSSNVDASSSDGGVDLTFAAPPTHVNASSSDGGVTIVVPNTPDTYRVDASSSDGGTAVSVRTDRNSSRVIDVHSSDGGVTVRYP